jgi:hypothetical protein
MFHPPGAKLVSPYGQAIKTVSNLRLMRRLFGELADESLSRVCGPRAYCCAGVHRGIVGGRGSGAVHGCRHRPGAGLSIIRAHQTSFSHRIISLTRAAIAACENDRPTWLSGRGPLRDRQARRLRSPSFQRSSGTVCGIRPTPVCKLVRSRNRLEKPLLTSAFACLGTIRKPGERPPAPRPNNGRAT